MGIRAPVVYTGEDGKTTGQWVVNVLERSTQLSLNTCTLATEIIPDDEQLTRIAGRTNAHSAVNGGVFVIGQLMARQATSRVFQ